MTLVKHFRSEEYASWWRSRPQRGQIDLELTERCNNDCVHCNINRPEHDDATRARELGAASIVRILQQAAELGCFTVRFTGGEPLLRDDFIDLYLGARRLGMLVVLFTNARRITTGLAQVLARIPPGHPIEITVYGMHSASYEAVSTVSGAFAEFWNGLELLRAHQIPFVVKQAVLPPNRGELAEFEAFAASLPGMTLPPRYTMNLELRARLDNPEKNSVIRTLRLTPEEIVVRLSRDPRYRHEMYDFASRYMGPSGDRLFACGAGNGACVDAYGKLQMCMGLRDPAMVYDILASDQPDPLRYALTEVFPKLRELRTTNPEYLRRCGRCILKGLCEQCPAKSWSEHGTLDTPVEYLCEVAHAQARYLGWLVEGEHGWERDAIRRP